MGTNYRLIVQEISVSKASTLHVFEEIEDAAFFVRQRGGETVDFNWVDWLDGKTHKFSVGGFASTVTLAIDHPSAKSRKLKHDAARLALAR